jgi:hypothetical protein
MGLAASWVLAALPTLPWAKAFPASGGGTAKAHTMSPASGPGDHDAAAWFDMVGAHSG